MVESVAETWAAVSKKVGRSVRWNHDDTDIDVSNFYGSHQVSQIVCQQIAPRRDLEFNSHADLCTVVEYAFRPIDTARLNLLPIREDGLEPCIEHFSNCSRPVASSYFGKEQFEIGYQLLDLVDQLDQPEPPHLAVKAVIGFRVNYRWHSISFARDTCRVPAFPMARSAIEYFVSARTALAAPARLTVRRRGVRGRGGRLRQSAPLMRRAQRISVPAG